VKTTKYFAEQVMRKRSYLKEEWCLHVLQNPEKVELQENSRVRYWGYVEELGKYLRVITLEDGETVHNAFPDRGYKGETG
jgi:hypothetical protein